ncbi:MAG: hypothetical protein ACO1RX_03660 [Candidatus Sericytochromatia bacterium]
MKTHSYSRTGSPDAWQQLNQAWKAFWQELRPARRQEVHLHYEVHQHVHLGHNSYTAVLDQVCRTLPGSLHALQPVRVHTQPRTAVPDRGKIDIWL